MVANARSDVSDRRVITAKVLEPPQIARMGTDKKPRAGTTVQGQVVKFPRHPHLPANTAGHGRATLPRTPGALRSLGCLLQGSDRAFRGHVGSYSSRWFACFRAFKPVVLDVSIRFAAETRPPPSFPMRSVRRTGFRTGLGNPASSMVAGLPPRRSSHHRLLGWGTERKPQA